MARLSRCKKWISAVSLTAMVWTGAIGTIPAASAAANPFSDVAAGHWAEKHIVKLSLQGIIVGSEGKFRPGDSIRREDAVIVALKFMGLADGVSTSEAIMLPSTLQVDDYAKPYVMEAIRRKLLLVDEESALANQEKDKHWGKAPASREWVARLLVRAIGKDAAAVANAGMNTAFEDNGTIGEEYRPYVLTAVQEGLVSGVTATTFAPKEPINRASIATLFSKAESKMNVAYSGQVSGVLLSASDTSLSVLHDDGSVRDYPVSSSTMYARYDSDKPVDASSLRLYGKILLIHDANNVIGYVEQIDDKSYIKTVEGTFSSVNPTEAKIWLSDGTDFEFYLYDLNRKPVVTDAQKQTIALEDIPKGTPVTLTVDTIRTEGRVISIAVKQALINKTGTGSVVSWDADLGALEVSDPTTGSTETLTVAPNAVFKFVDAPVEPEYMKAGDTITYEVKNGSVVSIVIAKPLFTTISGKLITVDKTNRLITIQTTVNGENKLETKYLSDTAVVEIQGMASPSLDDLQKDDGVTLTLDKSDKVTKITVNGRSVEYLTGATVVTYIPEVNQLTLKDASGKTRNFELNSNVRYDQNGIAIDKTQALARLTNGKKITVAYSGDNLITVYFIGKYSGTVIENNLTAKKLTVRVDPSNTVTLPYTFPFVDIYGKDSATYVDVKPGDQVTVVLNDNQDQITSIQYVKTVQFEVVSVNLFGSSIVMKVPGSSTTQSWIVPESALLQDEKGNKVSLVHFTPGSVVNATLSGKFTVDKIKAAPRVYGKVAAVNAAASTIDIVLANGSTVTHSVGTSPIVTKDSATNTSLSAIQPNDRVEIRRDENDRVIIDIVSRNEKVFWQYNSSNNTIKVRVSHISENNTYNLETNTYIHQGATNLTASQLKDGDKIAIYILRGKVVEIERL